MKGFRCANTMLSVFPQVGALIVDENTITRRSRMEPAKLQSLELKIL